MVQFRIREEIIIDHNEILKFIKSCSFVTEVFIDENKCIRPEIKYNTSDVDLREISTKSIFPRTYISIYLIWDWILQMK